MIRSASLFSQLVAIFDRGRFHKLVAEHRAERHAKGFSCWDQFVAMLFCQLAQAKSLREICGGLACCNAKLRHLGVGRAPKKSTLSYANAHRPWQLFQDLFYATLAHVREGAPKHRFCFKNKLLSLDRSTISLCLNLFPWAKFRRTKGAVKLHMLLDHDGYLPDFVYISNGKRHDVTPVQVKGKAIQNSINIDKVLSDVYYYTLWTAEKSFRYSNRTAGTKSPKLMLS
ncbi:MAG: DUF4372 domain-containing protein [Desulfobacterales bacterium]|jgi:hypothetical protein|nr:DUF4372 domain-containing protein [Desulfobacterales bacterium]